MQVEALFTTDANGRLRGINDPDGEIGPAPRFFFGHTKEGSICRFRYDLPENVVTPVWVGPAYRFPDRIEPPANVVRLSCENAGLLRGNFAKMVPELDSGRPYLAVIEDSQAVSIYQSVRLSWRAHEAGVDTLEAYRQRGYAVSTVAAWALAVRALDLVPLYSTSWENVASQRVARRLGLVQYGVDYHVT